MLFLKVGTLHLLRPLSLPCCRSHYGDLAVHSEAELNAALAAIDHKLHHETVPLAIEKKLIGEHKKLEQQRQRVQTSQTQLASLLLR